MVDESLLPAPFAMGVEVLDSVLIWASPVDLAGDSIDVSRVDGSVELRSKGTGRVFTESGLAAKLSCAFLTLVLEMGMAETKFVAGCETNEDDAFANADDEAKGG